MAHTATQSTGLLLHPLSSCVGVGAAKPLFSMGAPMGCLATIALAGVGAGIGIVFGSLIHSVSRNPSLSKQLFGYAILGFALSEAMALFALLVAFLILFGLIGFVGCSAFNAGGLTRCWVGSSVLERG